MYYEKSCVFLLEWNENFDSTDDLFWIEIFTFVIRIKFASIVSWKDKSHQIILNKSKIEMNIYDFIPSTPFISMGSGSNLSFQISLMNLDREIEWIASIRLLVYGKWKLWTIFKLLFRIVSLLEFFTLKTKWWAAKAKATKTKSS